MINKYNKIKSLRHNKRKHMDDVRVKRFWNLGRQNTRKHRELPTVANGKINNGNILFVRWIAFSRRSSDDERFIFMYELVLGIKPLPVMWINMESWLDVEFVFSLYIHFLFLSDNKYRE
jgi:hypothetical protein